jgi:hypothetical protein
MDAAGSCESFLMINQTTQKILISLDQIFLTCCNVEIFSIFWRYFFFQKMCSGGSTSVNPKPDADTPIFPGVQSQWTERLELIHPHSYNKFPVYRVLDRNGCILNPSEEPQV